MLGTRGFSVWAATPERLHRHGRGGLVPASRLLVFASQSECDKIASWRAGEESRSGGPVAKFDFVPSSDAPAFLSSEFIVGEKPPAEFGGLRVMGSYGHAWIVPDRADTEFLRIDRRDQRAEQPAKRGRLP